MSERRKVRLKRRLAAIFENNGSTVRGIVRNFSEVGIFVQTKSFLPIGSTLDIACILEERSQKTEVRLQGRVVSVRHDPSHIMLHSMSSAGMGINLINPPENYLKYIASLRGAELQADSSPLSSNDENTPAPQLSPTLLENNFNRYQTRPLNPVGQLGSGPQEFLVPELLLALWRQEFTGVLKLVRDPVQKSVYFKKGLPVNVESALDSEKLGQYLLRKGVLSPEHLKRALSEQNVTKAQIGQIMLARGFVDPIVLTEALTGQQEDKLINTFSWFDGSYQVSSLKELPSQITLFPLQLHPLIYNGLSKLFDAPVVRNLLPCEESNQIERQNGIDPEVSLPTKATRLYNQLEKPARLVDLIKEMHLSMDELLPTLFVLILYGYVKIS